jgi:hypothetical protein
MTSQHRKHRGYATQRIVANYLRGQGWAFAEPVGAGRAGSDITGTPSLDWEVKARRGFNPTEAMKQSADRAKSGVIPIVVLRPDGWGEAKIADFPAIVPLSVMTYLLKEAGYGSSDT